MKRFWIIAFIISIILHLSLVALVLYTPKQDIGMGGYGGEIGDFESVAIVSNLPIGEFREVSIDSVKALENYETTIDDLPEIVESVEALEDLEISEVATSLSNSDTKSEVKVKKAKEVSPKQTRPKKEKPKPKKDAIKDKEIKKVDKSKPISQISGEFNSISKDGAASAPVAGTGSRVASPGKGGGKSAKMSWQGSIMAHLNRYKTYPKESLVKNEEGKITVKVTINKNGKVLKTQIKKSSKYSSLNSAALELFKKASPLPPPPKSIIKSKENITFVMPIEYDIKKYMQNH